MAHYFTTPPAAAIGTIAHAVVERNMKWLLANWETLAQEPAVHLGRIRDLWAEEETKAKTSFKGGPESADAHRWPNYAMRRAQTIQFAAREAKDLAAQAIEGQAKPKIESEEWFEGADGRIVGRIDRITWDADGPTVEDFKTGKIRAEDGAVKEHYAFQLLLYSFLLHDRRKYWARRGRLVSLAEDTWETPLTEGDAQKAADRALQSMSQYNEIVTTSDAGTHAARLATPGPACRTCQARAWCEPYWASSAAMPQPDAHRVDVGGRLETAWRVGEPMRIKSGGRILTLAVNPQMASNSPPNLVEGTLVRCLRARVCSTDQYFLADLNSEMWWA